MLQKSRISCYGWYLPFSVIKTYGKSIASAKLKVTKSVGLNLKKLQIQTQVDTIRAAKL